VFGYKLLGAGTRFRETRDDSATQIAGYTDTQTGEQFGPAASTVFAAYVVTGKQ
jgi:hypothetical protein